MSIQSKTWELVLYEDCDRHLEAIQDLIQKSGNDCGYLMIRHDRDVKEDGALKKPHWHVVFCFEYDTSLGTCEKMYPNIESTMWTKKNNRKESMKYLIHATKNAIVEGKAKYSKDECVGDRVYINRYLGADHESNLASIIDYIEECELRDLTYTNITRWCIKENMVETLRKHSFMLNQIIREVKESKQYTALRMRVPNSVLNAGKVDKYTLSEQNTEEEIPFNDIL